MRNKQQEYFSCEQNIARADGRIPYPYPFTPDEIIEMFPPSRLEKMSLYLLRVVLLDKLKGSPPYENSENQNRQDWIDAIRDMSYPPPGIYIEQEQWHPGN